ncbi:MAG TPA: P1 family peptidase [Thermomicrobiales bacterium]|nr:P1 family peptidase [Thermomicrobiales bacterium]
MGAAGPTDKPRLRDLGIAIGTMAPGPLNAITDVPGVRVGHTTVIHGAGPLRVGQGPARTGVTAIHPHEGSAYASEVPAAMEVLNGAGEMTGRAQVDEYGWLETPILITNTLSVGEVHRGCVEWLTRHEPSLGAGQDFVIPVVAETFDGFLNDVAGQHVTKEHAFAALDGATGGPVAEGNVGGGTGMTLFGFKGGIGTASRVVPLDEHRYTVGVLVQGNFGRRPHLLVDGVPVGLEITDLLPERGAAEKDGSIIVVIGTDAPCTDRQLRRLCRRGMLGLGRVGATAGQSSGDLLLAFSNAPACRIDRFDRAPLLTTPRVNDERIDDFFQATIEATAEAVLNALVAAETMTGRDGNTVHALPHDRLRDVMRRYGRLREGLY